MASIIIGSSNKTTSGSGVSPTPGSGATGGSGASATPGAGILASGAAAASAAAISGADSSGVQFNSFLGTGWKFPPEFDPNVGLPVMVSDQKDIEESLNILLSTALGERVMEPTFGCDLRPYLFDPLTPHMIGYLKDRVRNAILYFETRITLISVDVTAADSAILLEGMFQIWITYSIAQTNSRLNYVYNYFQNEALQSV
jgi:phage baseplate assembly protein W